MLIFSGADDGLIRKYERLQLNTFMYSQESLVIPKQDRKPQIMNQQLNQSYRQNPEEKKRNHASRHKQVTEKLESWKRSTISIENMVHGKQIELVSKSAEREFKKAVSRNAGRYHQTFSNIKRPKLDEFGNRIKPSDEFVAKIKPSVLSLVYYEELDIIVTGCEDNRIYVFGYNEEAVDYSTPGEKLRDVLGQSLKGSIKPDSVTNRVAGMTLKYSLSEHRDAVSAVVCFLRDGNHYLLSTGWDRRICLWDLKEGKLKDVFRHSSPKVYHTSATSLTGFGSEELCADDIVLGIEYASERNEFCYCSADKLAVYSTNNLVCEKIFKCWIRDGSKRCASRARSGRDFS